MRPKFSSIPFTVYPVQDMDRACAFYRDVLGLVEVARWDNFWVEFALTADAPGPVVALATDLKGCRPGIHGGAIALEAPDFEGMVAHLNSHRVIFVMAPMNTPACHFARFLDSEGNQIILHRIHDDLGPPGS